MSILQRDYNLQDNLLMEKWPGDVVFVSMTASALQYLIQKVFTSQGSGSEMPLPYPLS